MGKDAEVNFDDTPAEAAFRSEVRAWLDANAPTELLDELNNSGFGFSALQSVDPLVAAKAWQKRKSDWLPSIADGDYVASLMQPVMEVGQFASWIAPPKVGIDNRPGDFEYVKIET